MNIRLEYRWMGRFFGENFMNLKIGVYTKSRMSNLGYNE